MTISSVPLSGQTQNIKGLSTDTKPTNASIYANARFTETDTSDEYIYSGTTWTKNVSSGARHSEPTQLANERNVGTANQYGVGVDECTATVIDGTAAIAVSSGVPALVFGILIITSANTATIVGLKDDDGVAKTVILTSSSVSQFFDLKGMKVDATFTVTDAIGDDVVVFWRAQ